MVHTERAPRWQQFLLLPVKDQALSERCESCGDVCLKGGHGQCLGAIKTTNKTADLSLQLYNIQYLDVHGGGDWLPVVQTAAWSTLEGL